MKKKFSQRSSTTQATQRGRVMGDDEMRILREDLAFARDLAALHFIQSKCRKKNGPK